MDISQAFDGKQCSAIYKYAYQNSDWLPTNARWKLSAIGQRLKTKAIFHLRGMVLLLGFGLVCVV